MHTHIHTNIHTHTHEHIHTLIYTQACTHKRAQNIARTSRDALCARGMFIIYTLRQHTHKHTHTVETMRVSARSAGSLGAWRMLPTAFARNYAVGNECKSYVKPSEINPIQFYGNARLACVTITHGKLIHTHMCPCPEWRNRIGFVVCIFFWLRALVVIASKLRSLKRHQTLTLATIALSGGSWLASLTRSTRKRSINTLARTQSTNRRHRAVFFPTAAACSKPKSMCIMRLGRHSVIHSTSTNRRTTIGMCVCVCVCCAQ